MRVIVTALGERTHLLPLVPVAWSLRVAGHDVVLAVPPQLVPTAAETGLAVVPIGSDHRLYSTLDRLSRLEGDDLSAAPTVGMGLSPTTLRSRSWTGWLDFYREHVGLWWRLMNDPLVPDLVALARRWRPDLVLWEGFTWAGAVAATVAGIPHVRVLSGSDLLTTARDQFLTLREARGQREDPLAAWLGGRLAVYGACFEESVVRGHRTIGYLPPSLRGLASPEDDPTAVSVRFVPHNGRAVAPAWLREPPARPRVCVTLGQSSVAQTGRYGVSLREVVLGIAAQGVEVVVTVPETHRAELEPLPQSVTVTSFVPLDALAPSCAAVVNHGGAATMCTMARHAVPQVVIPDDTYDERMLGGLLADAGAGRTLEPADVTTDSVGAAVAAVLDDAVRTAAGRLREEILDMEPPSAAVSVLECLAESASAGSSTAPVAAG